MQCQYLSQRSEPHNSYGLAGLELYSPLGSLGATAIRPTVALLAIAGGLFKSGRQPNNMYMNSLGHATYRQPLKNIASVAPAHTTITHKPYRKNT